MIAKSRLVSNNVVDVEKIKSLNFSMLRLGQRGHICFKVMVMLLWTSLLGIPLLYTLSLAEEEKG